MPEVRMDSTITVRPNPNRGLQGGTITINEDGTVSASRSLTRGQIRRALLERGYILGEPCYTKHDKFKIFKVSKVPVQEIDFSNEPEVITATNVSVVDFSNEPEVIAVKAPRVTEYDFSNEPIVIEGKTPAQKACEGIGTYNAESDVCELPPIEIRGTVR